MSYEGTYDVISGSGTTPFLNNHTALDTDITRDRFPGNSSRHNTKRGLGTAIINPEDFSVHFGLNQQSISVSTSAVALPGSPLEYRRALVIHKECPDILYIGRSNVTTANGFPIAVDEKIAIDIQGNVSVTVYGVSEGTSDVRLLELA